MSDKKKIGAAWKNKSKAGKPYVSITFDEDVESGSKAVMFPNGFKESDKHPDYIIYESQPMESSHALQEPPDEDEEIPFAHLPYDRLGTTHCGHCRW